MKYYTYKCKYTYEFPVDRFGRPGAFYSLADLPVVGQKRLTRDGILEATNDTLEELMFRVRDVKCNFTCWVPESDVEIGEVNENSDTVCVTG